MLPVAVTSAVAWLFPAGFLLIGGGIIALAVKARRRRARWEAAATSTSGEVTDLRRQSVGQAGDTNLLAFPVLRFSLPDGRTVETQSSWGTNPPEHVRSVTYRGPHAVAVKLKPGGPLPRGVRGMIDGEVTLPARGFELDQARLDQAVRAYADAGGSLSGRPGSGASSSGRSAGGPSG